jgi:biotin transport system substrate-specific component
MGLFNVTQPRTLTDVLLSRRGVSHSWLIDAVLIVSFSLFVALTARISIHVPFTPVPITGQTLGVLLTGAVLGSRRGALALLLYLFEGAIGLPVFAPSATLPPGIGRLIGPTGGYLLSYPLAAGLVGLLAERSWDRRLPLAALAMILGNLVIYVFGVAWLSWFVGSIQLAVLNGMLPFIPGDLLKIALAAAVLPGAWALVRRSPDERPLR